MLPSAAPHSLESALLDCCYTNTSPRPEVVRLDEPGTLYLERTLMPGQRLLFRAPARACLEIHTGSPMTAIHSDSVPCAQLQMEIAPIACRVDAPSTPKAA